MPSNSSQKAAETSEELEILRAHSVDYSGTAESRAGCFSDDDNPVRKKGMHRSLQPYSSERLGPLMA
jgi:hypothetical protein